MAIKRDGGVAVRASLLPPFALISNFVAQVAARCLSRESHLGGKGDCVPSGENCGESSLFKSHTVLEVSGPGSFRQRALSRYLRDGRLPLVVHLIARRELNRTCAVPIHDD